MFRFTWTIIRELSACASPKLPCWLRWHISVFEIIGIVAAYLSVLLCVWIVHRAKINVAVISMRGPELIMQVQFKTFHIKYASHKPLKK